MTANGCVRVVYDLLPIRLGNWTNGIFIAIHSLRQHKLHHLYTHKSKFRNLFNVARKAHTDTQLHRYGLKFMETSSVTIYVGNDMRAVTADA